LTSKRSMTSLMALSASGASTYPSSSAGVPLIRVIRHSCRSHVANLVPEPGESSQKGRCRNFALLPNIL
jgi:hypothetical protein